MQGYEISKLCGIHAIASTILRYCTPATAQPCQGREPRRLFSALERWTLQGGAYGRTQDREEGEEGSSHW